MNSIVLIYVTHPEKENRNKIKKQKTVSRLLNQQRTFKNPKKAITSPIK